MKNIKNLKPNNSRYKQGYIDPNSCKKLFPQLKRDSIIYRSSYEKKFIIWLEQNKHVKYWGSECFSIPYILITDGKMHSYYPDYFVELESGECWVVEIKPYNQTQKPVNENCWAAKEYIKNMCKWKATKEFCESKGYKFKVFTERTIEKL
jgi:hypothetical protein